MRSRDLGAVSGGPVPGRRVSLLRLACQAQALHGTTALSTAIVAAPSAAYADALSKPLFMSTAEQALAAAGRFGVDGLVVEKSGRRRATASMPIAPRA